MKKYILSLFVAVAFVLSPVMALAATTPAGNAAQIAALTQQLVQLQALLVTLLQAQHQNTPVSSLPLHTYTYTSPRGYSFDYDFTEELKTAEIAKTGYLMTTFTTRDGKEVFNFSIADQKVAYGAGFAIGILTAVDGMTDKNGIKHALTSTKSLNGVTLTSPAYTYTLTNKTNDTHGFVMVSGDIKTTGRTDIGAYIIQSNWGDYAKFPKPEYTSTTTAVVTDPYFMSSYGIEPFLATIIKTLAVQNTKVLDYLY